MLNTLIVKIKHPKLGEDVSTLWRKHFADYFESQITYVGGEIKCPCLTTRPM